MPAGEPPFADGTYGRSKPNLGTWWAARNPATLSFAPALNFHKASKEKNPTTITLIIIKMMTLDIHVNKTEPLV